MDEKTMKRRERLRVIKFGLFSVSAGLIELASFALLDAVTGWTYWPKYLIALILSVIWNFTLNRQYTFQSANNVPIAMMKVGLFYLVFTPVTTILGNYLAEDVGWPDLLVMLLSMAVNLVTEYLYDKYVVFKDSIDTNDVAKRELEKLKK